MDEDKPRKRRIRSCSGRRAKRFSRTRTVRLGGARPHVPPDCAPGNFFAGLARKPLIILDSGKKKEIFGSRWKAF
jgi:hypothetical protein